MHENNFEKQVREKMEQLQFDPADTVWLNVDKEINKEKKRRRPLLWVMFPLGILLLAGGGYYFITNKNDSSGIAKTQKQNAADKNQDKLSAGHDEVSSGDGKEGNQTGGGPEDELYKPENKIRTGITAVSVKGGSRSTAKAPVKDNSEAVNAAHSETSINHNEAGQAGSKSDSASAKGSVTDVKNKAAGKDSASEMKMAKTTDKKKNSFPWQIGYSGNAGISNMNQSLFKPVSTTNYSYNAAAPGNVSLNNPGVATTYPSEINPGFSFGLEVLADKRLSERFSLSVGLGYHYYSTEIQTGHFIDSTSFFNFPTIQASSVNAYYSNGKIQTYTNQYHFIELPVYVDFQINKSKKTALIWEGGFTLSYLLSSNALQFDPYSNVYFKSNQLFNRTQLSAATAFLIGLPVHHVSLQIGPQLQYGLTNVLKSSSGVTEHIIYYGLKVSFFPGK
jgi:hypothetical protein